MARNRQSHIESSDSNVRRTPVTKARPRQEEIALRAYELYERRGGAHGRDWEDWFAAERELQQSGRKAD